MQLQADYFTAYDNLKLTRDDKGVLVAEFHSNGGPFIMNFARSSEQDRNPHGCRWGIHY